MRVIDPGHTFGLRNLECEGETILRFHKDIRIHGDGQMGPSTQEVLRAVISRVHKLHEEQPHWVNDQIVQRGREMIALFEARALLRKVEKGALLIDELPVGRDGHIIIKGDE